MTRLIKLWELPGGIHLPEHKSQSMQLPLGNLPIPPQLIIALNQHIGAPAKPIVKIGDRVLAGQLIAIADGTFSANVHASSSGTVGAIGNYVFPHPSGMTTESIVLDTDGKHEWIALDTCEHYLAQERSTLLDRIRTAGVTGLGGAGFPTSLKLNTKSTQHIDTLVINGAECEPYITADDMLMQVRADAIIAGSYLLSYILHHPARIIIGVEDNKPKAIAALQTAISNFAGEKSAQDATIEIISVPTKYPSGGAKQLIHTLTGREIPSGHHSADVGAICVNIGTVAAAWQAVRFGEPLIGRVMTVVGESLTIQRNIDVLIGTPIDYVLQHHGFSAATASRVIMGGSMMGFTLPDLRAPVVKTTNCILAPSYTEAPLPPPAQACIRCGLCADVCPASLLPQQLFWYAQAEDSERLQTHHIFDCIECGACSYVCPSKIPLVQYYRAGKGLIRQQRIDKEKADRSRQRFEFRKLRIEREEAEKEAKRVARKKAAEEAKQKLAEQKAAKTNEPSNHTSPVITLPQIAAVVTAVAKANTTELSFDEQKARLERILGAAQNSLASARAPLVPKNPEFPITEEQLVRQQSRIKQCELKLAEAEKKLADLIAIAEQANEAPVVAAIARTQEKLSLSPADKLRASLDLLQARLIKAQEKAAQAVAEQSPSASALQLGVNKVQQKITETEAELAQLLTATPPIAVPTTLLTTEQNAAEIAIEKAKIKAAALANMSDTEKKSVQVQALQARLQKAKDRLAKAEAENDPNQNAFKTAVFNLEDKLKELL